MQGMANNIYTSCLCSLREVDQQLLQVKVGAIGIGDDT